MKNLQIRLLKFVLPLLSIFFLIDSQAQSAKIKAADSLFQSKQYTQSLELYQSVFQNKLYSPVMLLRMAYIEEGLGKIGPTLYYLKLYYHATADENALTKMEELATKFGLSGYEFNDASRLKQWLGKKQLLIEGILLLLLTAMVAASFFLKRSFKNSWAMLVGVFVLASFVFYLNNFFSVNSVIVSNDHTYLMEGPSAGSAVAGIVTEGNQFDLLDQEDVWLKVKWKDKIVFVKRSLVLETQL